MLCIGSTRSNTSCYLKRESDNPETLTMVAQHRSTLYWQDQSKTNLPKTTFSVDKSNLKCTHCNKTGYTKIRCFRLVGYLEWWDHNRDQQKKDSKKTSTVAIIEIKMEDNVAEKDSTLVAAMDNGGKVFNIFASISNSAWIINFGTTDHMTFYSRQVSPQTFLTTNCFHNQ